MTKIFGKKRMKEEVNERDERKSTQPSSEKTQSKKRLTSLTSHSKLNSVATSSTETI